MSYKFYRTTVIGTGVLHDGFRSSIDPYITEDGTGNGYWDWINDARPLRYVLASTDSATHTQIAGDSSIKAISPELADLAAVQAWLDTAAINDTTLTNQFESDGISASWIANQTSRRELWRYVSKLHVMTQDLKRLRNSDSLELFNRALTSTVSQLPAATRTKVASWMQAKGLDTAWVVGGTTVRQVLQYINENINWPILPLGPVTFS